ncbi:hypothetical protein BBBOND_0400620 [Babesia bigemina]|uniref:Uncharacterized protein n=1 Tax=Babesia bigemina TaxID=5866 RepID=A0A061DEN1_BABBI|nr:hypothetical protein BBBOND_0400620 [Babesia bigemina]CDR97570.1 hypothetical protein BBBOND_0400620 [Babesia bigemina]|eukprot:XP_012769756.1 hypothetical protein BBBOND_0400620 [Babesia bigemina]
MLTNGVQSNVLRSESSTVDAICRNVVYSITLLSKRQLLDLVDIDKCKDYTFLGEDVLASAGRGDHYCYKKVAPVLCETKYSPSKTVPNCEHIKSKFVSILNSCMQETDSDLSECNCSGINYETLTITDPLVFCKLSFVLQRDGVQISFKNNELDDCKSMADSYNHCQSIGKAFQHPKYCIDAVHDEAYNSLCRNIILPFIFSMMKDVDQNLSLNLCMNSDELVEKFVLAKRDALMASSQKLLDTMESDFAFKLWKVDMEQKVQNLKSDMQQVFKYFNAATRYTNRWFAFSYYFDPLVRSEASRALQLCEKMLMRANAISTDIESVTSFVKKIDPLFQLCEQVQQTLIHFKQFHTLATFRRISSLLNSVSEIVSQRVSTIGSLLDTHLNKLQNSDEESRVHALVGEMKSLAALHEAQIMWLIRGRGKQSSRAFTRSVGYQQTAKEAT